MSDKGVHRPKLDGRKKFFPISFRGFLHLIIYLVDTVGFYLFVYDFSHLKINLISSSANSLLSCGWHLYSQLVKEETACSKCSTHRKEFEEKQQPQRGGRISAICWKQSCVQWFSEFLNS